MFTERERERVRHWLLEAAEADPDVVGAAIVGSYAAGTSDRWSDIDLAFAVTDVPQALERWTAWLEQEFAVRHHWDLPAGVTTYRVFLLPGWSRGRHRLQARGRLRCARAQMADGVRRGSTTSACAARKCQRHSWAWLAPRLARLRVRSARPVVAGRPLAQRLAGSALRAGVPSPWSSHSVRQGAAPTSERAAGAFGATLARSVEPAELTRALTAMLEIFDDELRLADPSLAERINPRSIVEEAGR